MEDFPKSNKPFLDFIGKDKKPTPMAAERARDPLLEKRIRDWDKSKDLTPIESEQKERPKKPTIQRKSQKRPRPSTHEDLSIQRQRRDAQEKEFQKVLAQIKERMDSSRKEPEQK
ncbi:hypothetical protein K8Q94_00090 [Candidatus Nomurabacteria bacterium]|nr:hypothetical protein [Candidatus Nomurabacteria bacterium]